MFQSNIINILGSFLEIDVPATLYLLQKMAYYIHSSREYPIKQKSLQNIIDSYNKAGKKGRKPINGNVFINNIVKTKLVQFSNKEGDLSFISNNYLSYFIAKEILKKYVEDHDISEIEYLIRNVCFGINSDIVLFLCYLVDNTIVLKAILQQAQDFFHPFNEYDMDSNNIHFILKHSNEQTYSKQ